MRAMKDFFLLICSYFHSYFQKLTEIHIVTVISTFVITSKRVSRYLRSLGTLFILLEIKNFLVSLQILNMVYELDCEHLEGRVVCAFPDVAEFNDVACQWSFKRFSVICQNRVFSIHNLQIRSNR